MYQPVSPDISSDDEEFTSTFNINRNNDANMKIGTLDLEYNSTYDELRIIADTLYYPDITLNVNLEIYFNNGSRIYKLKENIKI